MKLLNVIKSSFFTILFLISFFTTRLKTEHYHNHYYPRFGDYYSTTPVYYSSYKNPENKTYYNYGTGFYSIPYNYGEGYGYISHYPYGRYDDYGPFLGVNNARSSKVYMLIK